MNKFLQMMDITFRRDPYNFRPRINKHCSQKDQIQKAAGNFFLMDEGDAQRTVAGGEAEGEDDEEEEEEVKQAPQVRQEPPAKQKKGKKGQQ